ncbi:MAG: hypothetical protein ABI613_06020 [Gemmatimonadota bacterium]
MDESPGVPETPVVPKPVRHGWRTRTKVIIVLVLLSPFLLFALYSYSTLHVDYSSGDRSGILQKFSNKGWVCKTWEGELAMTTVPGVAPTLWQFSVRNGDVAEKVRAAIGQRVALHYTEHRGVPTDCFGMTDYYVDSVSVMK